MLARIAMMAMTTNSSMRVKAESRRCSHFRNMVLLTRPFQRKLLTFKLRPGPGLHVDQRATQKLALKSITRGDRFRDKGIMGREFGLRVDELMRLFSERLTRARFEGNDSQASDGVAAGVLELPQLLGERRLARADACLVQRVNVVE